MNPVVLDINGNEIQEGQRVLRWPLINKKQGEPKERTVSHIGSMHSGGETMIWFEEGGGAHHPKACEVIKE